MSQRQSQSHNSLLLQRHNMVPRRKRYWEKKKKVLCRIFVRLNFKPLLLLTFFFGYFLFSVGRTLNCNFLRLNCVQGRFLTCLLQSTPLQVTEKKKKIHHAGLRDLLRSTRIFLEKRLSGRSWSWWLCCMPLKLSKILNLSFFLAFHLLRTPKKMT